MTTEQFDRLPKFARDELVKLRLDLDCAKEYAMGMEDKLNAALGRERTRTEIVRYCDERPAFLRDGAIIRFSVDGERLQRYLDVVADADGLEVRGGCPIVIRPYVSNVVHIRLEK